MGLQTYEYGLKPQDGFEVITHFEFTSQHLDILNRLFTPLIGVESIGLYHFMSQFIDESQQLGLTHYIFTVSYTHLPSPRDRTRSRMPSSA